MFPSDLSLRQAAGAVQQRPDLYEVRRTDARETIAAPSGYLIRQGVVNLARCGPSWLRQADQHGRRDDGAH